MEKRISKKTSALGLAVVVLFIVAVLTFPYAFNLSWALPGASSDRTLTYAPGTLTWDSAAEVDSAGTAKLHLFKNSYSGSSVTPTDNANIVAPNTTGSENVRLVNTAGNEIQYVAVLYRLDENTASIDAEVVGGAETSEYVLPEGVSQDQVEYAIGGTITPYATQIMAVDWNWPYYTSSENDAADENAGNDLVNDNVKYGLFVAVYDSQLEPDPTPDNGNNANNENTNNENTNGNENANNENTNGNTNNENTNGGNQNANENTNGNENQNWNANNIIDNINNAANEIENDINNAKNNINWNRNTSTRNLSTSTTWPSTWNTSSGSNKNYNTSGKVITPTTGDNSQHALLFAVAAALLCATAAAAISATARRNRKKVSEANENQMHET